MSVISGQAVISQGIKLFLKREQVYFFSDIGVHSTDSTHCPKPKELAKKCVCNKKDSIGKAATAAADRHGEKVNSLLINTLHDSPKN
jgi:hypothetical protein